MRRADDERLDATKLVREECDRVLSGYMKDPWRWPRESDLVADMVMSMQKAMGEHARVTAERETPGLQSGRSAVTVPRVRTEVKPGGNAKKVDIGVLGAPQVKVYLHGNGARDVVLQVDEADLSAIVEVKLEPGLTQDGWLADVRKLVGFPAAGFRVALWIDTSLPLPAVDVWYKHLKRVSGRNEEFPVWPLRSEAFTVRVPGTDLLRFEPVTQPDGYGVYLAGLGLKKSVLVEQFTSVLPHDAVSPCWWRVEGSA